MIDQIEFQKPEAREIEGKEKYQEEFIPLVKKYFEQHEITDRVTREVFTKAIPKMLWGENLITFGLVITVDNEEIELIPGEAEYKKKDPKRIKELLFEEDIPTVKIPDLGEFINAMAEYAETVKKINYLTYTNRDFFNFLFVNMTDNDFDDPVPFIRKATEIYKSRQLEELNEMQTTEKIPTLDTNLWIQQKPADPEYESPVELEVILANEEPEGMHPGTLPVVRFAVINDSGYVFGIQDMTRDRGAEWADKEGLDTAVEGFNTGAKELTFTVTELADKYPHLLNNIFGPVPKDVLKLRKNPRNFVLALNEFLQGTKPDLGKKYLDHEELEKYGLTPEIQDEVEISGNTIMFAEYCKRRDAAIQRSLGRRKFRKQIDRKLKTIVLDSFEYETEEAKEYLLKVNEINSKYNHLKAKAEKIYNRNISENKIAKQKDSESYVQEQRNKYEERLGKIEEISQEMLKQVVHVENISEVTPAAVVSLLVALTEMQRKGIRHVIAPVNMPLRWQNHIQTARRYREEEEKFVNIHHNITEKFVRTFRALAAHVPGIEIVSLPELPEMPLEVKLNPDKWDSKQPILHDVINVLSKPLTSQTQYRQIEEYWKEERARQMEEMYQQMGEL